VTEDRVARGLPDTYATSAASSAGRSTSRPSNLVAMRSGGVRSHGSSGPPAAPRSPHNGRGTLTAGGRRALWAHTPEGASPEPLNGSARTRSPALHAEPKLQPLLDASSITPEDVETGPSTENCSRRSARRYDAGNGPLLKQQLVRGTARSVKVAPGSYAGKTPIRDGSSWMYRFARLRSPLERGRRLAALLLSDWFAPSFASVERKNSRYPPRPATLRALRLDLLDSPV